MRKKIGIILIVLAVMVSLIGVTGLGYVFFTVRIGRASTDSMIPTLKANDRFYYNKNYSELHRGHIIMFRMKDSKSHYAKRIVGLPGESIIVKGGKVLINGKPLSEEYIDSKNLPTYEEEEVSIKIPANNYFVLGDNRGNSFDSRHHGTIDRSLIEGVIFSH